jgi:hypothetical protein
LKLNGTHQILVCADNILGGSMHAIKENTEAVGMVNKEIGKGKGFPQQAEVAQDVPG